MLDFQLPDVLSVQRVDETREHEAPAGRNSCEVLSIYLKGGPRYALDNQYFLANPPFGMLLPAGVLDHDVQQGQVEGIWVLFRSKGIVGQDRQPGRAMLRMPSGVTISVPMLKLLEEHDAKHIAATIGKITTLFPGDPFVELGRASLLLTAIYDLCIAAERNANFTIHRQAFQLRERLNELAFTDIPLLDIYRELGMSPSRMGQIFLKAFGTTPVTYRLQLRLEESRRLLMQTTLNVGQVARKVGFTDPLYFSRMFKKRFGAPPLHTITDMRKSLFVKTNNERPEMK